MPLAKTEYLPAPVAIGHTIKETEGLVAKEIPDPGQAPGKRKDVQVMFDAIAHRYDLLNHLLSFGIDRIWRRQAVAMLRSDAPRSILDVATGTGDLAIRALSLSPERIVGVDISEKMLERGRQKVAAIGAGEVIEMRTGASEELPFSDDTFDAAMVAFGVRNFENLRAGLSEIARVVRAGGPLVVLEFSRPEHFPVKQLYGLYFRYVVPNVGRTISRHKHAYQYLPDSVGAFPSGEDFLAEMEASGFEDLRAKKLTFGIASLYFGRSRD